MKNRDIYWTRYRIQEILYMRQWCLSPLQSRHLGTSHSSPSSHEFSRPIFLNLMRVWNLFPFKGDFTFGKSQSLRAPNVGCKGAESPGWFDVSQKNSTGDMMYEQAHCHDEVTNHPLPIAVAFRIIQIVSAEKCSNFTQSLMKIYCSTCSVILNVMATEYTCSLSSVYCPHWLVQWSCHCSHMCIPVHSPWLPGYTDVSANSSSYINKGWTFSRHTSYFLNLRWNLVTLKNYLNHFLTRFIYTMS